MRRRYSLLFILVGAFSSMGAQYQTTNFIIHAPNAQIAQQVGQYAEHYRKEKAQLWLGQEMPPWPQPCPLHVQVNAEGPSGATSFQFGQGRVLSMRMEIQGPLDRLLASVLPHEITHTVFAHHFRCPVPRWADEGGSVLSEDDLERDRHDKLARNILNQGRQIPLRRLFTLKEYPRDVVCLYAQGFSMCDYLVKRSDRRTLLAFIRHAMQLNGDWDAAVTAYYGHRNVEELEAAWLKHLREMKHGRQPDMVAQNPSRTPAVATGRNVIRMTVPPAQPLDPDPIVRGAMPDSGAAASQPVWIPVYPPPPSSAPHSPALTIPAVTPGPVQLGPLQFERPPANSVGFPK